MSRHKLVKALDLDDELHDYDGDGYGDGEDEGKEGILQSRRSIGLAFLPEC